MSWCFGCCAYQSGSMDLEPWSLSCFLWSWWRFQGHKTHKTHMSNEISGPLVVFRIYIYRGCNPTQIFLVALITPKILLTWTIPPFYINFERLTQNCKEVTSYVKSLNSWCSWHHLRRMGRWFQVKNYIKVDEKCATYIEPTHFLPFCFFGGKGGKICWGFFHATC